MYVTEVVCYDSGATDTPLSDQSTKELHSLTQHGIRITVSHRTILLNHILPYSLFFFFCVVGLGTFRRRRVHQGG